MRMRCVKLLEVCPAFKVLPLFNPQQEVMEKKASQWLQGQLVFILVIKKKSGYKMEERPWMKMAKGNR